VPNASELEAAAIDNYEERLGAYLANFTDVFQAEILEIQSENFHQKSIPVLKDVLETSMKFWSQYDVVM